MRPQEAHRAGSVADVARAHDRQVVDLATQSPEARKPIERVNWGRARSRGRARPVQQWRRWRAEQTPLSTPYPAAAIPAGATLPSTHATHAEAARTAIDATRPSASSPAHPPAHRLVVGGPARLDEDKLAEHEQRASDCGEGLEVSGRLTS